MALHTLKLKSFTGVNNESAEGLLSLDMSPDACNMDTTGGKLRVANGFSRAIAVDFLEHMDTMQRLVVFEWQDEMIYLVCSDRTIYKFNSETNRWQFLYDFYELASDPSVFDFQLAKIGSEEWLIIAYGGDQLLKLSLAESSVSYFGSAAQLSNMTQTHLALYYGRLFAAGNHLYPCRLYWSKAPGDDRSIEDWRSDDSSPNVSGGFVDIGTDSDPITGLFSMSNQLLIFKRDSLYRLIGDRPSNYRILPVDAALTQPIHTACVLRGDRLFFLTKSGLSCYDGQTVVRPYAATAMNGLLKDADLSICKAVSCGDKLYFAIRESEDATYNDALLEYDVVRGCWMIRRGFETVDMSSSHNKLYILTGDEKLCIFDDSTTYDGLAIDAYWTTPFLDMGSKIDDKQAIEAYASGSDRLKIEVDYGSGSRTSQMDLVNNEVSETMLFGTGRLIRIKLSNISGGTLELDQGIELLFDVQRRIM
ncbi:MAG: hypothetical protein Q4C01_07210 [Clostridia bacterium]|nr:hypothetical protein [Clostridia bacterium]